MSGILNAFTTVNEQINDFRSTAIKLRLLSDNDASVALLTRLGFSFNKNISLEESEQNIILFDRFNLSYEQIL